MKPKMTRVLCLSALTVIITAGIRWTTNDTLSLLNTSLGAVFAFFFEKLLHSVEDLGDDTDWKSSLRKLERGGFVEPDTPIRISFAYLYRIIIGNKYLLVKNSRRTGKFQPVGGVYKMSQKEKLELKNRYSAMNDDKIPIDESSLNDYRLRVPSRFLRRFVWRFSHQAERENFVNLGRELKEELVDKGVVSWKRIRYRVCGRYMSEVRFEQHFQVFELQLADIVELLPTSEQARDLEVLMQSPADGYIFATREEIESLGINTEAHQLSETIADHSLRILQEKESTLMRVSDQGRIYSVEIQ